MTRKNKHLSSLYDKVFSIPYTSILKSFALSFKKYGTIGCRVGLNKRDHSGYSALRLIWPMYVWGQAEYRAGVHKYVRMRHRAHKCRWGDL